ncbi:uncharacterized protein LOC130719611 [Lotus japonicus]|uniref:uncharacterized protein LOC130719611 n=1 Tax=Lotus japonicus TaxID=34305 RepID=UPI00258823DB|nr:uncharacterized protein LOC130719611 [Lotus japonicus]
MKDLVLETYSGKTDPKDHLLYFNTKMVISAASDEVKCRMFPSTFKGTTMAWFTTLPRGSIAKFRDFSSKFLVQLSASKIKQVTIDDLYNVRQLERETLKQLKQYSATYVKIEELEPQACAHAFKNGMLPGKLNSKLNRKPARSMVEVRARANTYILDEEDDTFKRRRAKVEKDGGQRDMSPAGRQGREKGESSKRRDKKVKPPEMFAKEQLYPKKENFERCRPWQQTDPRRHERPGEDMNTELIKLLREVKAMHAVEESEKEVNLPREAVDRNKWCEYHRSAGHDTSDCFTLKGEIERLIRAGRSQMTDRGHGGFGGGGDTPSARRRHVRAVSSMREFSTPFGFQHPDIVISSADFEGIKTHKDDPVVMMVRINSFNVRRVLLDQGSYADIIYGDAFDQLGLIDKDLMPYSGTLVGFSGEQVWVRDYLDLDTVFGVDENAKLLRVRYLVLRVMASYNVIIGRNTLNCLCVVISTAHLAVKYPLTCGKVGKIAVDQRRARECYNNCLSLYGKKGAGAGHRCHEIEVLEGGQGQQGLQGQGQGGVRRQERWINERYGGPRRNRSQ